MNLLSDNESIDFRADQNIGLTDKLTGSLANWRADWQTIRRQN